MTNTWIAYSTGSLTILAAIFNWDWFFNNWRAHWLVRMLGRGGARALYFLIGIGALYLGYSTSFHT